MGGVIFHEKQGTLTDCYKAWGTITLPAASNMLATTFPTFVSYVLFGCHRDGVGNFDAGLQVCGGNQYKLCLNGGNALANKPEDNSNWYEKSFTAPASASSVMTVELIYESETAGRVELSAFGQTLSAPFASGMWNYFRQGVRFWKEMTIASSLSAIISMWNSSNISRTQEVYMSDISFGEVKMLRHSGSSTQFSLDSYSTTTTGTQPIMDRQDTGSMPDWSKLRYGGVPTNGNVNVFSIDCRPQ